VFENAPIRLPGNSCPCTTFGLLRKLCNRALQFFRTRHRGPISGPPHLSFDTLAFLKGVQISIANIQTQMHISVETQAVVGSGTVTSGLTMANIPAQLTSSFRPSAPDRFADSDDNGSSGAPVVFLTLTAVPVGALIWMTAMALAWFS
jgi:hypothetical protein